MKRKGERYIQIKFGCGYYIFKVCKNIEMVKHSRRINLVSAYMNND